MSGVACNLGKYVTDGMQLGKVGRGLHATLKCRALHATWISMSRIACNFDNYLAGCMQLWKCRGLHATEQIVAGCMHIEKCVAGCMQL